MSKLLKRVLICIAATAVLAVPVAATGKAPDKDVYIGELKGIDDSSVKVKSRRTGEEHNVTSFFVREVPVTCDGDVEAILTRAGIRGEVPINNRKRYKVADDNGETTFRVSGRAGKRKSIGSFRYFGEMPINNTTRDCDTGELEFKARAR